MNYNQNYLVSKVKCPKCKNKKNLTLVELWKDHAIYFDVENGQFDRNNGALEAGDAYKVEAKCKECGHEWTLKGVRQIDDITP